MVVTLTNYQMSKQDVEAQQQAFWNLTEDHVLNDMQTVDKAYLYFDETFNETMETELRGLRAYYDTNPDIMSWDIEAIKERTNMEFYIIDDQNKVVVTTYEEGANLDFAECCEKFAQLLDERRVSDAFFSDGIDNSAATKDLWKYSYLSTSDHKYILELGVPLAETGLFESFNFFDTANNLVEKYDDLLEIRIFSSEGFILQSHDGKTSIDELSIALQEAYEQAATTKKPTQIEKQLEGGKTEIHRFLPYEAEEQRGNSTERIIYTKYSNNQELILLNQAMKQLWIMLGVAVLTSIMLLFVILKILNNTIKLATFDTLTGAYNRASYLQHMQQLINKGNSAPIGLLLVDLDNFKQVNDQHGHAVGDEVLKELTKILQQKSRKEDYVVRFGGDEFAIVLENASEQIMLEVANDLLRAVRCKKHTGETYVWSELSISMGGSLQKEPYETEAELFNRSDQALYQTKNNGKDGYTYSAPIVATADSIIVL